MTPWVWIDRKLDTMAAFLEKRWDRKGDAPRSQRRMMRRPLLFPLIDALSSLLAITVLEGLRVLWGDGGGSFHWLPLLVLAVLIPLVLPLQYRLHQHMARRYRAWQERKQATSQSAL